MDAIFMNSGNSKTSKPHILILKLTDKLDLRRGEKSIALLIEYILKKHNEKIDNPSIRIYVNKIENRITFKIKTGYYLELLTLGTMKLLGRAKSKITKDKNGGNVPHLEITEVILVHCNIVNNDY